MVERGPKVRMAIRQPQITTTAGGTAADDGRAEAGADMAAELRRTPKGSQRRPVLTRRGRLRK